MSRIYKYDVPEDEEFTLMLPKNAEILSIHEQRDKPRIWAKIDPKEKIERERKFVCVGTGHDFDCKGLIYVGTFFLYGGSLVYHLYEKIESRYFDWIEDNLSKRIDDDSVSFGCDSCMDDFGTYDDFLEHVEVCSK